MAKIKTRVTADLIKTVFRATIKTGAINKAAVIRTTIIRALTQVHKVLKTNNTETKTNMVCKIRAMALQAISAITCLTIAATKAAIIQNTITATTAHRKTVLTKT